MRRDVFQAIADPTRREIIQLIALQPLTPNSIAENFKVSRQAISKHIKILTESGILKLDVQGREYHYTVQPDKLEAVHDWLAPLREMWEGRFNQLDTVLAAMDTGKTKSNENAKKKMRAKGHR